MNIYSYNNTIKNSNNKSTNESSNRNENGEIEIVVYDDVKISLYKYPRNNTDKRETDIIITVFFMHEDYLKKLAYSYQEALKYYNECKEYFYIFNFKKEIRKFSAIEIITFINQTNEYLRNNPLIYSQMNYLNALLPIDVIFYFYIKNKDFYINLYSALEHAKKAYFERRDYNYRIVPPNDFYNKILPKTYSAIELMEIYAYSQFLVQNRIVQELPIPKYLT